MYIVFNTSIGYYHIHQGSHHGLTDQSVNSAIQCCHQQVSDSCHCIVSPASKAHASLAADAIHRSSDLSPLAYIPISSTIKSFAVTASPLSTKPYTTHTPATTSNRQQGIQSLLREYGPLALGVYLTLSFTIFCCCLASISFLGIDESHIAAAFAYLKGWVGYTQEADAAQTKVVSPAADKDQAISTAISWLPEWAQSPAAIRIGSNILLAMAMTKLFMLLKIAITAAIVPAVSKRARSMGFTLTERWHRKCCADVKSQMRS
ncbi:hypothetical protein BSLG_001698 [Batrachochytrium salamandrivorans]|nr:hypothetical protein BSLG_001698 [Batrachochytrium salamandrivorans]